MKYQQKPLTVEAVCYHDDNVGAVFEFVKRHIEQFTWNRSCLTITTKGNIYVVTQNNFIIKDSKNEIKVLTSKEFYENYDILREAKK